MIQKIYGSVGSKPFLDEGIRRDVEHTFTIAPEHENATLDDLATLYPAPTSPIAEEAQG